MNKRQSDTIKVSFIIPHKGREELLLKTIESITRQDFPASELEVIVVTQNRNLDSIAHLKEKIQLKTIFKAETETISALRNQGTREARGLYIAYLDADISLSEEWTNIMIGELEANQKRIMIGGIQQSAPDAGIIEKIITELRTSSIDVNVDFLPGCNLFLRKKDFEASEGFPENLVTCEDYYFSNKLAEKGDIFLSGRAKFIHLGEDKTYRQLFKKEIWRGQSNWQSMAGRKLTFSEIPSLIIPLYQFFFIIATLVSTALLNPLFASAAAISFLLPVFLYQIRFYLICKKYYSLIKVFWFYLTSNTARIIGSFLGLVKKIKV